MEGEAPCGIQFIPLMREFRAGWRVTSLALVVVLYGCGVAKEESTDAAHHAPAWENDMVAIPGGTFWMGAGEDSLALPREFPAHPVTLSPFLMDAHEVTNRQFAAFVEATGYVTVAERPLDWAELKTQLPPGTPRPSDADLAPGSWCLSLPNIRLDWRMLPNGGVGCTGRIGVILSARRVDWREWKTTRWFMCAMPMPPPMRSGVASGFRQRRNGSGRLGVDWKAPLFHGAKRPWVRG